MFSEWHGWSGIYHSANLTSRPRRRSQLYWRPLLTSIFSATLPTRALETKAYLPRTVTQTAVSAVFKFVHIRERHLRHKITFSGNVICWTGAKSKPSFGREVNFRRLTGMSEAIKLSCHVMGVRIHMTVGIC